MSIEDEIEFRNFLLGQGLTEKGVISRIHRLKQAENILRTDANQIVSDDLLMEASLRKLRPFDCHGNMQNALRKYYEMRHGRGFPRLVRSGGSPNGKPGSGAATFVDRTRDAKIISALDDLDWMLPGSFEIKRHSQPDWVRKFSTVEYPDSIRLSSWLCDFDQRLKACGYQSHAERVSEDKMHHGGYLCYRLAVANNLGRDANDLFDAEERQWIQIALDHLAQNKPGMTFRDLTLEYIRKVFNGDKLKARRAAWIDRRTFSALMNGNGRGVSKRTALQLAFAFELSSDDARDYLASAGIALKPLGEDCVYKICFDKEIYDFEVVNYILKQQGYDPLVELPELQPLSEVTVC